MLRGRGKYYRTLRVTEANSLSREGGSGRGSGRPGGEGWRRGKLEAGVRGVVFGAEGGGGVRGD